MRRLFIGFSVVVLLALSSMSVRASFTVDAASLWLDTGMTVSPGETLSFTASGSWTWGAAPLFGPDGYLPVDQPNTYDRFLDTGVNHGKLIGFVGPDPFAGGPFPQPIGSAYFAIGSSKTVTFSSAGKLWLGFNDDAVSGATGDNSGSVTVNVVPEPTTLIAGALSLLFLGVQSSRSLRRPRN